MIQPPYPEALAAICEAVVTQPREKVGVRQAQGRVLAEDLCVARDHPDLPRSAVDGYAIQSDAGARFRVVQEVAAGGLPSGPLQPGQAAAVMTGGVVPPGSDCVVMQENCWREGDLLEVKVAAQPGDLVNWAGMEAEAGSLLVEAGSRVGVGIFPTLFQAGLTEVPVHRRPHVGILTTGDEIREVEDGPVPGSVFNTNRYICEVICDRLGMEREIAPVVGDDPALVVAALDDLASRCDVIVTSGGMSVGRYDFVRASLVSQPFELLIQGTQIKPGRPMFVARHGGALVFAMPGYPSALMTNAMLYLVPALKKAAGRRDFAPRWFTATTSGGFRGRPGQQYMCRTRLELQEGRWVACAVGSQQASHFLNFTHVNGLVRMPREVIQEEREPDGAFVLADGELVDVIHFDLELS